MLLSFKKNIDSCIEKIMEWGTQGDNIKLGQKLVGRLEAAQMGEIEDVHVQPKISGNPADNPPKVQPTMRFKKTYTRRRGPKRQF